MKPLELFSFVAAVILSLLTVITFFAAIIRHSHIVGCIAMAAMVLLSALMLRALYKEIK